MAGTDASTSPHIRDEFSPMESLALRALRRYGDMSVSTTDGETILTFIDYANSVLDDVMGHPYWKKGVVVPYYKHQEEARPIPDNIMIEGLLAKLAVDKESKKARQYMATYFSSMNSVLLRTKFGVGAEFSLQAVDYPQKVGDSGIPGVN